MVPLQRCVWALLGTAQDTGAGVVSIAKLWKPYAEQYLKTRP